MPMRAAFLTHEPFYPPSGGGSAEAVYLVQELVRRGHEVHVFCPKLADAAAVEGRFGIEVHEFTTWQMGRYASGRNLKYVLYPFFLERMVSAAAGSLQFDVLISQHTISAVAAGRLRRKLKVPVVMNFLDYLSGFMETWPSYAMPKVLLRRIMNFELSLPSRYQADGVMTVSDTLADYFADAGYPRTRLCPIYYGYDADLFRPADARTLPTNETSPVIVMHGSFDQHHLGPIAREAIVRVHQRKPAAIFRFVGQRTPALTRFVEEIRKISPDVQIECAGFVPYAEVASHLAPASVGIVPYEESRGVHCAFVAKIVEYVGMGLPVVSTPLDSARRYFGKEPLVRFSEFNGRSFGEKILSWLNEPLDKRRSLGPPAVQRVRTELNWRAISRKAIEFVEKTEKEATPRTQSH